MNATRYFQIQPAGIIRLLSNCKVEEGVKVKPAGQSCSMKEAQASRFTMKYLSLKRVTQILMGITHKNRNDSAPTYLLILG